jgi:hypothetical protein
MQHEAFGALDAERYRDTGLHEDLKHQPGPGDRGEPMPAASHLVTLAQPS